MLFLVGFVEKVYIFGHPFMTPFIFIVFALGKPFPSTVNSMNAYYGAGPIVNALNRGADIVVTGRATDSALALAPLIHEFGWADTDFDKLAAGNIINNQM